MGSSVSVPQMSPQRKQLILDDLAEIRDSLLTGVALPPTEFDISQNAPITSPYKEALELPPNP